MSKGGRKAAPEERRKIIYESKEKNSCCRCIG
jgi:hypothetical protein